MKKKSPIPEIPEKVLKETLALDDIEGEEALQADPMDEWREDGIDNFEADVPREDDF